MTTRYSDPDQLVIYPSRVKMVLVLLGSIAFVVIGAWIGVYGVALMVPIWEVLIASVVGVPFFAACGLYAAYRLVRRRPALEIDAMGITDQASALAVGRLQWDEVDHVRLYKVSGQWMLGIIPRDLEGFLIRQHPVRRSVTKLNLRLGCAPVNVPQVSIRMKLAALANLLEARYRVRVVRESDPALVARR